MAADPIIEAYLDRTAADAYVSSDADWSAASNDAKDDGLYWGAVWIDTYYDHPWLVGDSNIPDEILRANSLLAAIDIAGNLYRNYDRVKRTKVKAGGVETETEYQYRQQKDIRFKKVHMLLGSVATRVGGSGMVGLSRA